MKPGYYSPIETSQCVHCYLPRDGHPGPQCKSFEPIRREPGWYPAKNWLLVDGKAR